MCPSCGFELTCRGGANRNNRLSIFLCSPSPRTAVVSSVYRRLLSVASGYGYSPPPATVVDNRCPMSET